MTKILLIEDDRTFSRILDGFLTKNKYETAVAYDGAGGIKTFFSGSFDLVLLDYRLPDANGLDMLSKLKLRHNLPVFQSLAQIAVGQACMFAHQGFRAPSFARAHGLQHALMLVLRDQQDSAGVGHLCLDVDKAAGRREGMCICLLYLPFDHKRA